MHSLPCMACYWNWKKMAKISAGPYPYLKNVKPCPYQQSQIRYVMPWRHTCVSSEIKWDCAQSNFHMIYCHNFTAIKSHFIKSRHSQAILRPGDCIQFLIFSFY